MIYLHASINDFQQILTVDQSFSVGRGTENHLVISNPDISLKHFQIEKREQGYVIKNFSRHGTWLNSAKIMEAILQGGDHIQVGQNVSFQVQLERHPQINNVTNSQIKSFNPKWSHQLQSLPSISQSNFPVLLLGESGSGKEVLAREIHRLSKRQSEPMICINCSTLSESLIESELFGHIKGSFTGAQSDRKGAFESAKNGTLFLDEIGDLPMSLQPKLLRALENSEIRPVGSDKTVKTNVRIISATHQSLTEKIEKKIFRSDLYYRLNVMQLCLPPLRSRMEDFEKILYSFSKKLRVRFSHEAILQMKTLTWPGNIRELKNFVSRVSVLFPKTHIREEHILQTIETFNPPSARDLRSLDLAGGKRPSRIQNIERALIIEKLSANYGNQRKTAAELGVPKSTLHDRIRSYGINVKEFSGFERHRFD